MVDSDGGAAFDPASLDDESLALFNACRHLAKTKGTDGESLLARAHRFMVDGQVLRAIDHLRAYLDANEIDLANPPKINGPRLAQLRKARDIKAKDLARALNVSPSALTQLEKGNGKAIGFIKILVAAEIIGYDPRQFFAGYAPKKLMSLLPPKSAS